jgi:hypothetical protein
MKKARLPHQQSETLQLERSLAYVYKKETVQARQARTKEEPIEIDDSCGFVGPCVVLDRG